MARIPGAEAGGAEALRLVAEGLDWALVERVAKRHRVEGLVHKALGDAGLSSPFSLAAQGIARRNLAFAAEAARLHARFAEAGLAHLFVKGVTLDILAWRSLALKTSIDIDLLVDPTRYAEACAILFEAGYRCTHPGDVPAARVEAYARRNKDSVWRHRRRGITVELHARLSANPALLPGVDVHSSSQMVEVAPSLNIPTLARDPLFAYLCVHGALTAWSRLKWVADLAAFLSREDDLEGLYRRGSALAPGRAVGQALLVCEELFGLPLGPLAAELRGDERTRWLARTALATMVRGGPDAELGDQSLGTARIHYSILFLQKGLRYKAADVTRQIGRVIHR
ncbi:MAG TPA: nucleotidyltransferase family protein [Allosphingosinicella sp.]